MRRRELAALFLLAALWGASFLFIRVAAPALGPFPLMAGRVLLAALVLWAIAACRRTEIVLLPYWRRLMVLGLIHAAAPFALIAAAEIHLDASMAAVLLAVQPLFTALLSAGKGEALGIRRWAGLALGIAGVAILVGFSPAGGGRTLWASSAAVLLAALLYAAGSVYSRRHLGDAPVMTLALGQQLAAAIWLLAPALLAAPRVQLEPAALGAMAALAIFSTAIAYQLFFWLIARAGVVNTSLVTYLIPIFGIFWGVTFLGEPLGLSTLAGLGCILGCLLLASRRPEPRPAPAAPASPCAARSL